LKRNIVLINRWSKSVGFTNFEQYIDHREYDVHYVVVRGNEASITVDPTLVRGLHVVADLSLLTVREVCREIVAKHGAIDCLVAMAELDILTAAQLRDEFDIDGMRLETARRFIDKSVMKTLIRKAGIPTPEFRELADGPHGLQFPLILKPKRDASSRGVTKLLSPEDLERTMPTERLEDYLLEEFCPDEVYHLDGFVRDGKLLFQSSNQYIGTCLDFSHGSPLGSVEVTDPEKRQIFRGFVVRVLVALALDNGSFHLECFLREKTPIFLEIGARAGGGDIREVIQLAHGFDIVKAWIDVQLGQDAGREIPASPASSGFLVMPGPTAPAILMHADSYQGRFPCIKNEKIPPPGHRLSGKAADIFENSLARFQFVGDEREIRETIEAIKTGFKATYVTADSEATDGHPCS
jgi:biotin carboxylase